MAIDSTHLLGTQERVPENPEPNRLPSSGQGGLTGRFLLGDCCVVLEHGLALRLEQRVNGKWIDISEQRRVQ